MKTLTIRNVPDDLHGALQRERARRGRSQSDGARPAPQRLALGTTPSNGLAQLAGAWTDDDLRAFESATQVFEEVDEEVWR